MTLAPEITCCSLMREADVLTVTVCYFRREHLVFRVRFRYDFGRNQPGTKKT